MADVSVPGLAVQTPVITDTVPGIRASTGLLDARFSWSAVRTLLQANLSAVAFNGAYSSLSGTPSLGTLAALSYPGGGTFLKADGTWASPSVSVAWGAITGTLTAQSDLNTALGLKAATSSLAAVALSGAYSDLSGKPSLATVATTGVYSDLTGKPTLGNVSALAYSGTGTNYLKSTGVFAQVAYGEVSGTPSLATVATTGAYSDLSGKPTLATVATTGAYSDLSGKPTLGTVAALSYPGGTTTYLRADGTFAAPAGGGDVVGPASSVNNRVAFFSGTTGKLLADSGLTLSGTNTGDQTSVTGNAGTATTLATSRNIDGVAFNGSANITVIAPGTTAATSKATPVDADELPLVDSAASNVLKKLTWANLKVGVKSVEQNSQSTAYTAVLADANKHLLHPAADTTARIFTIPANSSVAYPIGTALTFVNQNAAGVMTIAITTDTMRLAGAGTTGSRTLAANGIATALKITSTEWIINGTGLT